MSALFFPTPADFREWLEKNHEQEAKLIVGFYKIGSGKASMTWSESVDQALCFGWIDGVRRSIDEESYAIRFTPRKAKSIWSAVNIKKIEDLTAKNLMMPAGIAAYAKREESKSKIYTYENEAVNFAAEYEAKFKAQEVAWSFFEKQANWYRKQSTNWVMSAKQESTRLSRLEKLITESAKEKRI